MFNKKSRLRLISYVVILGCILVLMGQVTLAVPLAEFKLAWPQGRPTFDATQYVASGIKPEAIMAGVMILQQGGNATDAGIAIHAAANVVDPQMTGLGGDSVMLLYLADQDKVTTIQALGWAAKNGTIDYFMKEHGELPNRGPFSVNIPGGFAGWIMALTRYGTMSLAQVFAPAIELAEKSAVTRLVGNSNQSDSTKTLFVQYPTTMQIWWKHWWKDGEPLAYGDAIYQTDLANTFKKLVAAEQTALASGKSRSEALRAAHDLFYKGEIGKALVDFLNSYGHVWEYEDMAEFEATEKPPIMTTYRGYEVYNNPPTSQGMVTLMSLNILEGYDLKAMGRGADYYHRVTETLKLALRDREAFNGDPDFVQIPLAGLLSKDYAASQRARINPDKAMVWPIEPGDPWKYQSEKKKTAELPLPKPIEIAVVTLDGSEAEIIYGGSTDTFHVVDKDRNVFAQTGSINSGWGSGMVLPGYGFMLNNRFVTFQLDPKSPNAIAPHKVVHHTVNNVFVKKDGKPYLVIGTPGGDNQTQGTLQVLLNVIEFGMNIQQAIENARGIQTTMLISRSFPYKVGETVQMEWQVGEEVIKGMEAKGHKVDVTQPYSAGGNLSGTIIQENGVLHSGSDPRNEGYAIGW
jgi:gamma-glutamyltranspeptidase/glutathione hydrolase